jgi:hypothetical protein
MIMRPRQLFSTLFSKVFCTFALLLSATPGSAAAASAADEPRQAMARWLTQQLHCPVEASQILVSPDAFPPEGCVIQRARRESIGATSLSVRCPEHILPQLVLLKLPAGVDVASAPGSHSPWSLSAKNLTHGALPLVRAGALLNADWRTDSLHALLPVVALDSGAAGAEIRVRIAQTNRILHARILGAHNVSIIVAGA